MAYLEKLIKYGQAVLAPAGELEVLENGSRVRLQPLAHLAYLLHFDWEGFGALSCGLSCEEINRLQVFGASSGHQLVVDIKKFGFSSLRDSANKPAVTVSDVPDLIAGAPELTIDFWYRTNTANTNGKIRSLVERWYPYYCWRTYHINRELGLDFSFSPTTYLSLQTSGLNLNALTWYHLRFTMKDGVQQGPPGQAKIFVNGSAVAACELGGPILKYSLGLERTYLKILNHLDYTSSIACHLDELRILNQFLPDNFTPPTQAAKPFSVNLPTATVSLDAGAGNALWVPAELAFQDETDFANEGIKLRLHADNDNSPEFAGAPLTLAQARELGNLSGRYLHLEFSFGSDGDTQRNLSAGKVGLKPQRLALARRAPEIIRSH